MGKWLKLSGNFVRSQSSRHLALPNHCRVSSWLFFSFRRWWWLKDPIPSADVPNAHRGRREPERGRIDEVCWVFQRLKALISDIYRNYIIGAPQMVLKVLKSYWYHLFPQVSWGFVVWGCQVRFYRAVIFKQKNSEPGGSQGALGRVVFLLISISFHWPRVTNHWNFQAFEVHFLGCSCLCSTMFFWS